MTANLPPSATHPTSATGSAAAATASWQERNSQLLALYLITNNVHFKNQKLPQRLRSLPQHLVW